MPNRFAILCLLGCLLILAPCLRVEADTKYVLITLLHTNDMHGNVLPKDDEGGLARVATMVRQIRADMPHVLLMDAGDIIHGTSEEYLSGGRSMIAAMNASGYQVAATGNHEYDFGLDTLHNVIAAADFPFLAANIHSANGGQWDKIVPSVIFNEDGVKIGVIGLDTLETITLHWPESIKGIVVEDPIITAQKLVPVLRKRVDVLVVLSHLGYDQDILLAGKVPGIDFIVGGHSHDAITEWKWVGDTLITQAGAIAKALGRIDFIVKKDDNGSKIVAVNGKTTDWSKLKNPPLGKKYPSFPLMRIDKSIPVDDTVRNAYMPYRAAMESKLGEIIGNAPNAVPGEMQEKRESPAADLLADAVRDFAKSEISIVDPHSVEIKGIPQGQVTADSIFNLIGGYTRQQIVVARIPGDELQLALNKGFTDRKAINIAISGASIDFALNSDTPKIVSFKINGQPIDPKRLYTVATQAYVLMEGIMKFAPGTEVVSGLNGTTREALLSYCKKEKTIISPVCDRIKFIQ